MAGETAAALAAASIFYNNINESVIASEALDHAETLFKFADEYRGKYSESVPIAEDHYR